MMYRLPIWLFLCLALPFVAMPTLAQTPQTPWPTEGWTTSTPEAQGINSAKLAEMVENIVVTDLNIHSVLVVRNGYLVLEAYRYPHTAETLHHIYSCTKSFTSALVGIAQEQGFISSIEQPLLDFFPEREIANLDEAKKSITVQHLLTMSSGLDWPGGILEPILGDLHASEDWLQFVLDRPVSSEPGEQFVYNSGGSNLLAAIVETATGQPLLDFAQENLFKPLGITHVSWQTDPQDYYLGGWGLHLEPRDMAKFGYLYLNGGQWDGQQVIPAEWVTASTQKQISSQPLSDGYGYQWWVDHNGYTMALGYGGQYILVYPEKNLVVVFTSGLAPTSFSQPENLFGQFILPAVEADTALPENAEGTAALEEAIESLANPTGAVVPPLPATAAQISGQTFQLSGNDFGWKSFTFNFTADSNTAELVLDGELPLKMGLDNVFQVNPLSAEDTILAKGNWQGDNRLGLQLEIAGSADWVQMTLTFNEDGFQGLMKDSSGASSSVTGKPA